jgi:hypothetical protein
VINEIAIAGSLVGNYLELVELMDLNAEGRVTPHAQEYALNHINVAINDFKNGGLWVVVSSFPDHSGVHMMLCKPQAALQRHALWRCAVTVRLGDHCAAPAIRATSPLTVRCGLATCFLKNTGALDHFSYVR